MPRTTGPIVTVPAIAAIVAATLSALPGQATVPPPPTDRSLIGWTPGEVRCGADPVLGQPIRRPWNVLSWGTPTSPDRVTYRFAIDATGRPMSITRDAPGFVAFAEDTAPALAASRFAPDAARQGCTVTFARWSSGLGQADVVELMSYTIHSTSGPLPKEGWDRIRSAAGSCFDMPYPQPLIRHLPDFRALPATPGVQSWSMIAYDLDTRGKPVRPRVFSGTGNAALDKASLAAIRASRFTKGARTGCFYPFHRAPMKMEAPAMPPALHDAKVDGSTCPDQHGWANPPQLRFPEPWRRRSIEGWAVVSYDVATWGELGNMKVVAAEPSSEFGDQAMAVLRSARFAPSPQGHVGCVDRVKFVMGPENMPPADADGSAPPAY